MKICFILNLWGFFFWTSFASAVEKGAYEIMPGRNPIEQEINWAFRQLPDFLKACSYSKECQFSASQTVLLNSLLQKFSAKTVVQFVSQKEGGFVSDQGETERLALTGRTPGAVIYINQDLYSRNGLSYGLPFWMGLLSHELIHHLGIEDGPERIPDQFGVQVSEAVKLHLLQVLAPPDSTDVQFHYLNLPIPNTTKFFQDFPKGEFFRSYVIDAKGVIDDASMRDLDRYMPYCPGEKFFMTQVRPESAKINPVAGQSQKFIAQLSFGSLTGCYNQSKNNLHPQDLFYLHSVGLKLVNGHYEVDYDSDFNWREALPSDEVGGSIKSDIVSSEIPKSILAPSKLVIEAQLKADPKFSIMGCSISMTSPDWPVANQQAPFTFDADDCRVQTLPVPGLYAIHLERWISDETPTQDIEVRYICLEMNDRTGDCIPAYPTKKTMIHIENKKPVRQLTLTEAHFENVTLAAPNASNIRYEFDLNQGFNFIFNLSNAKGIERILLVINGEEADHFPFTFMVPLFQRDYPFLPFRQGANELTSGIQFTPNADGGLKVISQLQYPAEAGGFKPVLGLIMGVYVTTTDLQGIYVDLVSENLSFRARAK